VFRFAETFSTSYRYFMTTAEQFRAAVAHPKSRDVSIAGVPWPAYKVLALAVGLLTLLGMWVITAEAATAVLGGAAAATAVWLALGTFHSDR
jgi:hypothetical protein